jgi:hypothetical protein
MLARFLGPYLSPKNLIFLRLRSYPMTNFFRGWIKTMQTGTACLEKILKKHKRALQSD